MNQRRLVYAGLVALWLIGLGSLVKYSIDGLTEPTWGNPAGTQFATEVADQTCVGETFRAPWPGLYRIDAWLEPTGPESAEPVAFHLKTDVDSASDLRTAAVSTDDLADGAPCRFEFAPIRESKGSSYFFCLESPDEILRFNTYYSLRTREKVDLLLTRLSEGRPYIFGTKGFYIGLAIAQLLVLGVFLLQIVRMKKGS